VSHLHQLFNTETCHSYIHALRWKDRPVWSKNWNAQMYMYLREQDSRTV
jgi:hypothetical protein